MRSLLIFVRAYPARTAIMLACLLLAGAAEGFSVASAVPLIALAADPPAVSTAGTGGGLGRYVLAIVRGFGLEPTIGVLLLLVIAGICLRAVLILTASSQIGYTVAHVANELPLTLLRSLLRSRWQYYVHQPLGVIATTVAVEARRAADAYLHATTLMALLIQAAVYVAVGCLVS